MSALQMFFCFPAVVIVGCCIAGYLFERSKFGA